MTTLQKYQDMKNPEARQHFIDLGRYVIGRNTWRAEFARQLGLHATTVQNWCCKSGRPPYWVIAYAEERRRRMIAEKLVSLQRD